MKEKKVNLLISSYEENSLDQVTNFFTIEDDKLNLVKGGNDPMYCRRGYYYSSENGMSCKCGYKS